MTLQTVLGGLTPLRKSRVSRQAGVDDGRLEAIVHGASPRPSELVKIARALRLHPSTLLREQGSAEQVQFLFRSTDSVGTTDPVALQRLADRLTAVGELLDGSPPLDRWLDVFVRGDSASGQEATSNAALFRSHFVNGEMFGPIPELPALCVGRLHIALFTMEQLPFDGASAIRRRIPIVFLARRFASRMLFSLAHELGHLVAHHAVEAGEGEFIAIDRTIGSPPRRKRQIEQYAHSFASELLMPAQGMGLFLQALRRRQGTPSDGLGDVEILLLARYYNVSFAVAAMRCEQLQLIPQGAASQFASTLSSLYGSPENRGNMLGLPPRSEIQFPSIPAFLVSAAAAKIANGEISLGRASELLGVSVGELVDYRAAGRHRVDM